MDAYSNRMLRLAKIGGSANRADWNSLRRNMGHALNYANRMDFGMVRPQSNLNSTKYCLTIAGKEYLLYQPNSGGFSVEIASGKYQYEWFNPASGRIGEMTISDDGPQSFTPAFSGNAVLFLQTEDAKPPNPPRTVTS